MTDKLDLELVDQMPRSLTAGKLYVSEKYRTCAHLCACGCGSKVGVPLGDPGYKFFNQGGLPTLRPSIGSWQLPCRSHYFITNGKIEWCGTWSDEEVAAGQKFQDAKVAAHYKARAPMLVRAVRFVRRLFGL